MDENSKKSNDMTPKEKKRTDKVMRKIQLMLSARDPQLKRWEELIQKQQFQKDAVEAERRRRLGLSYLRIPMENAFVESKTSDEAETIPFPIVVPKEPGDIKDAKIMQDVFDYVTENKVNLKEKLIRMYLKQKNTLGDGIVKVYWSKEIRTIRIPIKAKSNGEIKYREDKVTVYDDIKVDVIDIRNFAIDPIVFETGKTLEDANYCCFFSKYEKEDFEDMYEDRVGYKNIEMVEAQSSWLNDAIKNTKEQVSDVEGKIVEVVEVWDILKDSLITLANGIEIRETAIPYMHPKTKKKMLPIAHFIGHMSATGFYNFGEIDLIRDLIEERETQRNINLDAAKNYTHPLIVIGGINDFDADEVMFGPNGLARVDDVNQMTQMNMAGNTGLPFSLEEANQNDAVTVTGHNIEAVLGGGGETATKTLEKKESQIKRTKFGNTYNELYGFRRMYELINNLILQYYDNKKFSEILGESNSELISGFESTKTALEKDYNISVVANNQIPASKELSKLRNQEMLGILGSLPIDPNTGKLPPHLVEVVRLSMYDLNIPEDVVDEILDQGEYGGGDELQAALQAAQDAGLDAQTNNFGAKSPNKKASTGSVQENTQRTLKNTSL